MSQSSVDYGGTASRSSSSSSSSTEEEGEDEEEDEEEPEEEETPLTTAQPTALQNEYVARQGEVFHVIAADPVRAAQMKLPPAQWNVVKKLQQCDQEIMVQEMRMHKTSALQKARARTRTRLKYRIRLPVPQMAAFATTGARHVTGKKKQRYRWSGYLGRSLQHEDIVQLLRDRRHLDRREAWAWWDSLLVVPRKPHDRYYTTHWVSGGERLTWDRALKDFGDDWDHRELLEWFETFPRWQRMTEAHREQRETAASSGARRSA